MTLFVLTTKHVTRPITLTMTLFILVTVLRFQPNPKPRATCFQVSHRPPQDAGAEDKGVGGGQAAGTKCHRAHHLLIKVCPPLKWYSNTNCSSSPNPNVTPTQLLWVVPNQNTCWTKTAYLET